MQRRGLINVRIMSERYEPSPERLEAPRGHPRHIWLRTEMFFSIGLESAYHLPRMGWLCWRKLVETCPTGQTHDDDGDKLVDKKCLIRVLYIKLSLQ